MISRPAPLASLRNLQEQLKLIDALSLPMLLDFFVGNFDCWQTDAALSLLVCFDLSPMPRDFQDLIAKAVGAFWDRRSSQQSHLDPSTRSSVTAAKHLDGFLDLLSKLAMEAGVPDSCIIRKGLAVPGFFRPAKAWDLLIVGKGGKLVAAIELKSQVGSIGNNFPNRIEEALGNAQDLWTAYREGTLGESQPWLGYIMILEKIGSSTTPVRIPSHIYKVRPEFIGTSYMDRYALFCKKLMHERHYHSAALLWTTSDKEFGKHEEAVSFERLLNSFIKQLQINQEEFV